MSNPSSPPDKNARLAVAPRYGVPRSGPPPNPSSPVVGTVRSTHASSFPTRGEEVTPPTRLPPGTRAKTSPINLDALRSKLAEGPQLDERDSIFATTYSTRESPEPSPRLSPLHENPTDIGSTSTPPSDMAAIPAERPTEPFRQPHRTGPTDRSYALHTPMPYPIGVHRHVEIPLDVILVDPDQPSPRQHLVGPVRSQTIQPFDTHGLDRSSSSSTWIPTAPSVADGRHAQASPPLDPGYEAERQLYRSWREGKPALAQGRTSQAIRVDKKIEATLPKMDVSAVARSRKASHTLGIFKENEAAEDKKRMEHLRELMATAALRKSQRERRRAEADGAEESSPETPRLRAVVALAQARKHGASAEVDTRHPPIAEDTPPTEPTRASPEKPVRPSYTPRSSYTKSPQHTLLELPDEDDDNESDHEISKALYFPHRQVTLEEQEGFEDEDAPRKRIPSENRHRSVQDAVTSWKEDMLSQSPGEVEISIKSQDKKQLFHEVGRRPTEEPTPFALDDASSCDSFDEYRSVIDDSSATEDWETTPMQVGRTPSQRRSRSKTPAPLGAVELEPFDHQVGGHSTVYRFSRAAVCKQLNNRENEFYETVEQNHPELLDFLPRYIGVLNVTYRKAPKKKKPEQQGDGEKAGELPCLAVQEPVKPPPRIVSHQQQPSNQIPEVVLENNRHIIPDDLFVFPRRRGRARSTRGSESLLPRFHQSDDDVLNAAGNMSSESSPSRPSPRQHAGWGATTVNRRLQEQVLREVFSPPPVHRHARRDRTKAKSRGFKPSQSFSVSSSMSDRRGNMSSPNVHGARRHDGASTAETSPAISVDADLSLVSRSAGDRTQFAMDQSPQPHAAEDTHPSAIAIPRRRRSGGNLRRPLLSIESNRRTALEYHEDEEGYGGDGEDDMLPEEDRRRPTPSRGNPPSSESVASDRTVRIDSHEPRDAKLERPAPVPHQLDPPFSPPLNPIQSQIDPDSRVEHFILLEDLTAGMARPCVLDLKMGTRQYGVEATPQKQRSQRRKCQTTTSRELGVRVCGMQVWNNKSQTYLFEDKYFGRDLKSGREFQDALTRFFFDGTSYSAATRHIPVILEKLTRLEAIIRRLPGYRFYASSLLMLYDSGAEPTELPAIDEAQSTKSSGVSMSERSQDATSADGSVGEPHPATAASSRPPPTPLPTTTPTRPRIRLKIVDFANCVTAEDLAARPDGSVRCPPRVPGGVDRGYLRGVRSLRLYFQRIWREVNAQDWVERGDGEGMSVAERGAATVGGGWDDAADGEEGEVSV